MPMPAATLHLYMLSIGIQSIRQRNLSIIISTLYM